jgi:hypothetical protein
MLADTQTEPGNASFRKDTHENEIDHATRLNEDSASKEA